MQKNAKRQSTLMSKKYFSMLLGGTLTMMVASILLMSDSVIAGAAIGRSLSFSAPSSPSVSPCCTLRRWVNSIRIERIRHLALVC